MAKAKWTKADRQALKEVLDYLSGEKSDYEAQGNPRSHIYLRIQKLEKYLEC